jgi:hypothetical protein
MKKQDKSLKNLSFDSFWFIDGDYVKIKESFYQIVKFMKQKTSSEQIF